MGLEKGITSILAYRIIRYPLKNNLPPNLLHGAIEFRGNQHEVVTN